MTFTPVSGAGTIVQYIVVHQTKQAGFEHCVPYGAAAVELDEQPGLIVVGNVVGSEAGCVRIGDRVTVDFEPLADHVSLPQFRRTADTDPRMSDSHRGRA